MSGIVEKVGKDVTDLRPGDKVWTSTYYRDVRAGCFQELVVVPTHTVARIPDSVSFEAAACLGVPALTACMTLWKWLKVPLPSESSSPTDASVTDNEWLLIWGGSTVTGQFATQVAAQSGLKVITVNSASTKALSERLGASHVVIRDGKTDDEIVAEIRQATHGAYITRAIDLVGAKTAAVVLRAVSAERPVEFAPLAFMKSDQEVPANVTAHTVEMKRFVLDVESKRYADELNKLLDAGKLVIPDIHLLEGGLEVVQEGLDLLKKGDLKGRKLVVKF
jgi:NADPH:quinone reductase-like Zn-dependent oxidoreductase